MDLDALWQEALPRLAEAIPSPPIFHGILLPSRLLACDEAMAVLAVPNAFAREQLQKGHHHTVVAAILGELTGGPMQVALVVDPEPKAPPAEAPEAVRPVASPTRPLGEEEEPRGPVVPTSERLVGLLDPECTFDTFVHGSHAHFAYAAAFAVAEKPGKAHNPLFIYGGVGLGKTHLMQAIAHQVLMQKPRARVAYVAAEAFANELIAAIRKGRQEEFRSRYRKVDLLLLDDVQMITRNHNATQEELFSTFNELKQAGKQVVFSADRPPHQLNELADRLRSRFGSGFVVDIVKPDLETRIAILQGIAAREDWEVPAEVLEFLATHVVSSVREMAGGLRTVVSRAGLAGKPVGLALAQEALGGIAAPKALTLPELIATVARRYGLQSSDLLGERRTKDIAMARFVAMHLARELTEASLATIGQALGGRDHTTVMNGIERVRTRLASEPAFAAELQRLAQELRD